MNMRLLPKPVLAAALATLALQPVLPAGRLHAQAADAGAAVSQETARINESIARARDVQKLARSQSARGEYGAAVSSYDYALSLLDSNSLTASLIDELRSEKRGAETSARQQASAPVREETPGTFEARTAFIDALLSRGRDQFVAGDYAGAETTFKDVETRDPNNTEAKTYLFRIAELRRGAGVIDRTKTREQMLEEVSRSWQRPGVFQEREAVDEKPTGPVPLLDKLNRITIPSVNFTGVELSRVISTLSSISEEFDDTGLAPKGVNIVLIDPNRVNPAVNITLRNLTLRRVLDFITDSVGFQYEVQLDAVVVRPGGEVTNLDTEFFPVSRATVIRMVAAAGGKVDDKAGSGADPFASTGGAAGGAGVRGESEHIRNFFQQAGVNFEGTQGASLVYDGSALLVTQTSRNISRIRNILNRYNDVRQVEIEAKFLDVAEGVLEELGIDWKVTSSNGDVYQSNYRTLSQAFSPGSVGNPGQIIQPIGDPIDIPNSPPTFPGGLNLGTGTSAIAVVEDIIGSYTVSGAIRAISQNSGSDLLSAPKVTVISGEKASITVAQEFRYPESYGEIQSEVGQSGTGSNSGSAGVTITAGTPQNFKTRNVGVELAVTPTVEDDDYSISLDLNPRVTEFDGFVEYGGQSIAIAGGTTVNVPSGFFQPIFSVREMNTKVTVWDGATVVMGGLTREEVKKVNDKIPFLGDIPGVGRLFRSEGESNQKRNLLVFVTANLVSPGGSLKKQDVRGVTPNSLFQNPTIVTPGGSVDRTPKSK
ncbi:MAG: type II secretion system protein GspD [Opitutaceae bacterium]|nr:type II secretion system protein GspD [Opitutaceae bacterium]